MSYSSDPDAKKVLVVDDDLALRRSVIRILQKAGFSCHGAVSNQEARAMLVAERYAVVITDMRMWGEDGLELMRHISDEYPETFTIMMTGFVEPRLIEQVSQSGGYALVQKPFGPHELVAKVEEALEQRAEKVALLRHVSNW
ncbi:MAG TPA: response regulator [Actinomycetota bacterium]|nr:response regulator [Actinomycetota bacterium]